MNRYNLVFKTGDAEIRALQNINYNYDNLFPIIELTRGRKSKFDKVGDIDKRLNKIREIFAGREICLDLTTSNALSNEQIETLFVPDDGYSNWTNFLLSIENQHIFKSIVPNILIDTNDGNFENNLIQQVQTLCYKFDKIAYRNSLTDDGCYEDINLIKNHINQPNQLIIIIDCEYVAPGAWESFADKVIYRISKLNSIYPNAKYILVSTSFPRIVSEIGNDDTDTFLLNEISIFKKVTSNLQNIIINYGDYGSINPIRNDDIPMSRGWIPRIDVPLQDCIFYYRERRGNDDYSSTYRKVARDYIINEVRFPSYLDNWGIEQIKLCADGYEVGSSPSFWISVRMNIHINQQLVRLR